MKVIKYAIVLTFVLLGGCLTNRKVVGEYGTKEAHYVLKINKDSTFTFNYRFQFTAEESSGKWKVAGERTISLTSNIQEKKLLLSGMEADSSNPNGIESTLLSIRVDIPQGQRNCYECLIFVNDTLFKKVNCDSIHRLPIDKNVTKLYLKIHSYPNMASRFLDTLVTNYYLPAISQGPKIDLDLQFRDSLFNYKVFKNSIFVVSKRGLRYFDSADFKWKNLTRLN
jgi:hypothetical protein